MSQFSVVARPVSRRQALAGAALGFSEFTLPACSAQQGAPGSATGPPRRGGTLTLAANASSVKEKLDPHQANGPSSYLRNVSVFDTLLAVAAEGWQLQPRLAQSWEPSTDLMSWRFTLRKDVTFHDGRPLDAKDVVWTFRRILDSNVGSGAFARALTVVVTLTSPDSLVSYAFADPHTVIIKEGQQTFDPATSIGTGPYKLVSWTPSQSLELERNPRYWDAELPYLDEARRDDAAEEATASQGVLSGNFDVAEAVSYAAADQLGKSPNASLHHATRTRGNSSRRSPHCPL